MNIVKECARYVIKDFKKKTKLKLFLIIIWIWVKQNIFRIFEIPYLEIMVTTKCNLNCVDCSNLIPQITQKNDESFTKISYEIEKILKKVSCIYRLKIHGGEVFLHNDCVKLINFLGKQKKIKSIRIATNGTVVPSLDIIKSLRINNVVVQISDYTINHNKIERIINILNENSVKYKYLKDQVWYDMGNFQKRGLNRSSLCNIRRCTSLYNEKIYVCSRAAMMDTLNYVKNDFYIDINASSKVLKKEMKKFYRYDEHVACNHCDGDTAFAKIVKPGIQN